MSKISSDVERPASLEGLPESEQALIDACHLECLGSDPQSDSLDETRLGCAMILCWHLGSLPRRLETFSRFFQMSAHDVEKAMRQTWARLCERTPDLAEHYELNLEDR